MKQPYDLNAIYYYKDRPYKIVDETKIKVGDEWVSIIRYRCLYQNPDGEFWNRFKAEFFRLFKTKDETVSKHSENY